MVLNDRQSTERKEIVDGVISGGPASEKLINCLILKNIIFKSRIIYWVARLKAY